MDSFSIAQLAQFSGVKAHTIRIWEKRYGALNPLRSEGNTRHYQGQHLRRLLNLVSLMERGYRISDLAAKPDAEIERLIQELFLKEESTELSPFISQLIAAGVEYNEWRFQQILSHCMIRYGVENCYKDLIYPLLKRVGLMWAGNILLPGQEHFISNIIRQKLLTATDALPLPASAKRKWLLFLPEDEHHEFGLLYAQYVLRKAGDQVYYLGSNVPLETLISVAESVRPTALFFFLVHRDSAEAYQGYLDQLSRRFPGMDIYIGGDESTKRGLTLSKHMHWMSFAEELENNSDENSFNLLNQ